MRACNLAAVRSWFSAAMAGLGVTVIPFAAPAEAASFDCGRAAAPVEKTICADARLSQLDGDMGRAFNQAIERFPASRQQILSEQRAWLRRRDSICNASDVACLRAMTEQRLRSLSALAGGGGREAHGQERGRAGIPAPVVAAHRAASGCEEPGAASVGQVEPITAHLSATKVLYAMPCFAAAYNLGYRLYVHETAEREAITQLYFPTYSDTHHWGGTATLFNISLDGRKLTAFYKGRGLGDCGTRGEWTWVNHDYRLDWYAAQDECRGIPPEEWPVVFPPGPPSR